MHFHILTCSDSKVTWKGQGKVKEFLKFDLIFEYRDISNSVLVVGVIHGDTNAMNVIVGPRNTYTSSDTFEVVAMLDWQDCHCAPIVFELAILCMYQMCAHKDSWDLDVLSAPLSCIEGFSSIWKLPESELSLLPTLIMARFAQSLCLGAYNYYILDPTNEYLLDTAQNGWRLLRLLWQSDREVLLKQWGLIS